MKIAELLDRAKHDAGIESDYALAKTLGIHKARVSAYYSGKEAPNEWACLRISEITGIPLDTVIATVKAASEKDDTRREAWENYMKRLGGLAASVLITLCVTVTMIVTSNPVEASPLQGFGAGTICIMLSIGLGIAASQLQSILCRVGQKSMFRVRFARITQIAA